MSSLHPAIAAMLDRPSLVMTGVKPLPPSQSLPSQHLPSHHLASESLPSHPLSSHPMEEEEGVIWLLEVGLSLSEPDLRNGAKLRGRRERKGQ